MQDPIEVCPAVLVKRYDITQQKELELQLAQQQVGLQKVLFLYLVVYFGKQLMCLQTVQSALIP